MKANITNLKKALRLCAKAHDARFHDWSSEGQLGIESETNATVCDVRMICEAFFGASAMMVEPNYGYTTVWLEPYMYGNKSEVNMELCLMALPYGTKL